MPTTRNSKHEICQASGNIWIISSKHTKSVDKFYERHVLTDMDNLTVPHDHS